MPCTVAPPTGAWIETGDVNVIEVVKVNGVALTPDVAKAVNIDLAAYATTSTMNTALSGKVDVVSGKGLSANDYTTAEKTKLAGIATGAQVNTLETVKVNGTALTITGKAVDIDLSGKVDKETGKGLMTDAERTKLEGIEAGAEVNAVSGVSCAGAALIPDANKNVNIPQMIFYGTAEPADDFGPVGAIYIQYEAAE